MVKEIIIGLSLCFAGSTYAANNQSILPGGCVVNTQKKSAHLTAFQAHNYIQHVIDFLFFPPIHNEQVSKRIQAFTLKLTKKLLCNAQSCQQSSFNADELYDSVLQYSKVFVRQQACAFALQELHALMHDELQRKSAAKAISERIFAKLDAYSKEYKESELPICAFEHFIGKGLEFKVRAEVEQDLKS